MTLKPVACVLELACGLAIIGGSFAAGMHRGSNHKHGILSPSGEDLLTKYGPLAASMVLGYAVARLDVETGQHIVGEDPFPAVLVSPYVGVGVAAFFETIGYAVGYYHS